MFLSPKTNKLSFLARTSALIAFFFTIDKVLAFARAGEPQEFAIAAVFLVSPAASYIHSIALAVDGCVINGTF